MGKENHNGSVMANKRNNKKKKEYLANNYFVAFYKKSKETKIEIIEIFPKYTEIK